MCCFKGQSTKCNTSKQNGSTWIDILHSGSQPETGQRTHFNQPLLRSIIHYSSAFTWHWPTSAHMPINSWTIQHW